MMIQNQQNSPNFGANLFITQPMSKVGGKVQIKAFSQSDIIKNIDVVLQKGSQSTDIFVSKIQKENIADKPIVNFLLKNPLFIDYKSTVEIQKFEDKTNSNDMEILEYFANEGTKNFEILENKACEETLKSKFFKQIEVLLENFESIQGLRQILTDAFRNNELPQCRNILSEMLTKTSQKAHGFSDERIKDFEQIADKLQNDYETFLKEEILPKV